MKLQDTVNVCLEVGGQSGKLDGAERPFNFYSHGDCQRQEISHPRL